MGDEPLNSGVSIGQSDSTTATLSGKLEHTPKSSRENLAREFNQEAMDIDGKSDPHVVVTRR